MAVVRWNPMMPWQPSSQAPSPFEGIASLRSEMDRLFDSFFGNVQPAGTREALWNPRVDLVEHDQEFVLVADLPGMKQEDMDISVQHNLLTLQGKRMIEHVAENGNGNYHYTERAYGTFCRRFALDAAVETEQITATYKDGVLEVHIPKTTAAQPKRITVQASA
jgi:HSP20 family protein